VSDPPDVYDLRELERRLAEDDATAELGVHVHQAGSQLIVHGWVSSSQARTRMLAAVREGCPGMPIIDELTSQDSTLSGGPAPSEEIR